MTDIPHLLKNINLPNQEAKQTPSSINSKRSTSRQNTVKMLKPKENLESRKKNNSSHTKKPQKANFSSETVKARRQ